MPGSLLRILQIGYRENIPLKVVHRNNCADDKYYYRITMAEQETAKTVFVNNIVGGGTNARIGTTYICMSDNYVFPPSQSSCTPAIFDTGFIKVVDYLPPGKVLTLYRENASNRFSIYEIRVSQMPNLIEFATVIIFHDELDDAEKGPENLTTNLENRTHKSDDNPRVDADGNEASYYSCYEIPVSKFSGSFVVGFDHGQVKFQHQVIMVQNCQKSHVENTFINYDAYYTSNWDIYIGNDPVWENNSKAPGGPYRKSTLDDYTD